MRKVISIQIPTTRTLYWTGPQLNDGQLRFCLRHEAELNSNRVHSSEKRALNLMKWPFMFMEYENSRSLYPFSFTSAWVFVFQKRETFLKCFRDLYSFYWAQTLKFLRVHTLVSLYSILGTSLKKLSLSFILNLGSSQQCFN